MFSLNKETNKHDDDTIKYTLKIEELKNASDIQINKNQYEKEKEVEELKNRIEELESKIPTISFLFF
jgi:hypothetical protein